MEVRRRVARLAAGLAPTVAAALLFGAGIWAGRYFADLPTKRAIDAYLGHPTLGSLLEPERRSRYASAFLDPGEAEADMDDYLWDVPVVPTPFVGNAPAPGRHANATINAQQFRHPADLVAPKPAGVFRIFLTGGSTAFGSGAPDQARTISGYLQGRLDRHLAPRTGLRYEVINAANTAWSTTHERLWIAHHLVDFEPDLILSLSGNNDVHWGLLGRDVLWMRTYGDQHFWSLLRSAYRRAGRALPDVVPAKKERVAASTVVQHLEANVVAIAHFLGTRDVPYLFALQPTVAVSAKTLSEREATQRSEEERWWGPGGLGYFAACYAGFSRALGALDAEGYEFLDLSSVFDADDAGTEIFLDSYHFGDRGNERIAGALYGHLESRLAGEGSRRRGAASTGAPRPGGRRGPAR